MPKRSLIAAIDVGTNSFHVIIASVSGRGAFTVHSRDREIVRLGEGAGDMKYLSPDAIDRGVLALKRFGIAAKNAGAEIRAIATSAVREALNKEEFLRQVYDETGIAIEVISGTEEARLIYLGVLQSLPVYDQKILSIDIGGGSTETTVGFRGEMLVAHSAKLGAIRLMQKFFVDEKVSGKRLKECREFIKGEWSPTFRQLLEHNFESVVGTSGTIETIFSMVSVRKGIFEVETMNGAKISQEEILWAINRILEAKTIKERADIPGMDPKRADIILSGALILEQAVLGMNIKEMTYSGYALREGILLDTVNKQEAIEKFHHLSRLRYETVMNLCESFHVNMPHAEHIKTLALKIFDLLHDLHKYGDVERELLEAAAYLHDVGYHISSDQHHKHSYYMIRNATMLGFTNDEAEIIANLARYHRKSHPKMKHDNFQRIASSKRRMMSILAGILRIAEGLDRRQLQKVHTIKANIEEKSIKFFVYYNSSNGVPDIEIWGAERRKALLEEILEKDITFRTCHL